MKCTTHPEADAVGFCRNCGKSLCSVCVRQIRDVFYCEDCLAQTLGHGGPGPATASPIPPIGAPPRQSSGSPAIAFILGFIFPGLGAVYNGEYSKALIHIVIFCAFILGLASDMDEAIKPVLGILLGGFIFYLAFDSMRVAKAKESGAPVPSADPLENWGKSRPVGPIILIGLGVLLLLSNFGWWYRVQQFWPVILIVAGLLMFRNRLERRP